METERFSLNTGNLIPRWFVLLVDGGVVLLWGATMISLAVRRDLASALIAVLFAAVCALTIGFIHTMTRGFANPDKNFVELEHDHFRVTVYDLLHPLSHEISYALVERIDENAKYSLWWPFGFWPYSPVGRPSHVLIRLRHIKFLSAGWGRISPWVRVVHLDVMDRQRFADTLRERVVRSTLN
ncbi:MAG: hypothetical protein IIB19_04600 [Chloroflexi bacterium]|nr:hypothetical protein [Chloroflexota bacterium]